MDCGSSLRVLHVLFIFCLSSWPSGFPYLIGSLVNSVRPEQMGFYISISPCLQPVTHAVLIMQNVFVVHQLRLDMEIVDPRRQSLADRMCERTGRYPDGVKRRYPLMMRIESFSTLSMRQM